MSYYKINKVYSWLYSIYDPGSVFCYLLVGEKSALLYDTVFGVDCLHEAVRQVTDLPYEVVLGHGHVDHVGGASQFDEVWIHPADYELCIEHASEEFRRRTAQNLQNPPDGFNASKYISQGAGNLKMLAEGQIFELGGLTAEVIPMEGHTAGSVGLLIREHKVLLNSDAASAHTWMFLNESLPMSEYISMLKRVKELDFDTFIVGHSDEKLPKLYFDKYIAVAENIDIEKSEPYGAYPDLGGRFYAEGDVSVVFNPKKLK